MEIPLNAQVECQDGVCGHSVYVLINPVLDQVTHLVVKTDSPPIKEYVVSIDFLNETIADTIRLRCSQGELEKMDPFIYTTFIQGKVPEGNNRYRGIYGTGSYYYAPYITTDKTIYKSVKKQQIPPGELAVWRGTRVEGNDGYVGRVDEFVVNPENGCITHLVMREGHLWGKKEVMIPLSAIGGARGDTVFLKLDRRQIETLPTFPVHRLWS
jgi:sporulation protein YlmC with PRC-barrel domain